MSPTTHCRLFPWFLYPPLSIDGTVVNVPIGIVSDKRVEGDEVAKFGFINAAGALAGGVHSLTIQDDDVAKFTVAATNKVSEATANPQLIDVTLTVTAVGSVVSRGLMPQSRSMSLLMVHSLAKVAMVLILALPILCADHHDCSRKLHNRYGFGQNRRRERRFARRRRSLYSQVEERHSGATIGVADSSLVTIQDDEKASVTIEAIGTLTEAATPDTIPNVLLTITGSKSGASPFELGNGVSVNVNLAAVPLSAVAADYTLSPTSVSFSGTTTSIPAPISVVNDGLLKGTKDSPWTLQLPRPLGLLPLQRRE